MFSRFGAAISCVGVCTAALIVRKLWKRPSIKAIIFDKDGTLIEFDKMWSAWLLNVVSEIEANVVESGDIKGALRRKIFEKIGFDSENNTVIGDGVFACGTMKQLRDITAKIVADLSTASPRDIDAILDRVWKTPDPVKLAFERANLNKLFRTLKSDMGLKVAICTTDDEDPTMQSLKALNAADLPDAILCGDMGIAPKPSRDQILYICKKIGGGIKPSETVMVGDTPRDMRMGRASGCALCIGILGGAGARSDLREADIVISSLGDIPATLLQSKAVLPVRTPQ